VGKIRLQLHAAVIDGIANQLEARSLGTVCRAWQREIIFHESSQLIVGSKAPSSPNLIHGCQTLLSEFMRTLFNPALIDVFVKMIILYKNSYVDFERLFSCDRPRWSITQTSLPNLIRSRLTSIELTRTLTLFVLLNSTQLNSSSK
jgi:hypothetical protein